MKSFLSLPRPLITFLMAFFLFTGQPTAQTLDVPYVPTPRSVVEKMLEISEVGPGDYVIDLGSGDGRIVIAAATKGAVGHGIDLNPQRIAEAEQNAKDQGVSNRVIFLEGDLFETDISQASVVTMYLLSSVNLRLRPRLLKELKPGTRIVSHGFSMGEWEPDQQARVDNRSVYFWVIPARVEGTWDWTTQGESFSMNARQEFQKIHLELQSGSNTLAVRDPLLHGERICFTARNSSNGNHYVFNGRVEGNIITGTAQIRNGESGTIVPWSATFTGR